MISIENLSVKYFTEDGVVNALNNLNLTLDKGLSLGIAGESACGKSTFGSAIIRSIPYPGKVVEGQIIIDGYDILKLTEEQFNKSFRWKKISMIFQGAMNSLDPVYKIGKQMEEILHCNGMNYDNSRQLIITALKSVGLSSSVAERYPHEISGGMKQRVVIAMSLLLKPDIVIADEPTTALDVLVQAQVISLLKRLKKQGLAIILISHDLSILSEISDMIAIMYAGEIVEYNSCKDIFTDPKHPYTKGLLSSIPRINSSKINYIPGSPPNLIGISKGCRFYPRCPYAMDACLYDIPNVKVNNGFVKCCLYLK